MIFLSIFFISLIATSHLANATGDDELKLSLTAASCNRNSKSKKSQETYKSSSKTQASPECPKSYPTPYYEEIQLVVPIQPVNAPFRPLGPIPTCPNAKIYSCDFNSRYSTIEGYCNNVTAQWLGGFNTPFKRYVQTNTYDDGISTPRKFSITGAKLPNSRSLSRAISNQNGKSQYGRQINHLLPIFGQFVVHDTSLANPVPNTDCTNCDTTNPNCVNIPVPPVDDFMQQSCIPMIRTQNTTTLFKCDFPTRVQLNSVSAFIDLTPVYGANTEMSKLLRTYKGGKLSVSPGMFPNGDYLRVDPSVQCGPTAFNKCFLGGESRTNENMGLAGVETLFTRNHNLIAANLAMLNPTWNDELLFQESRKINIAILQHIVFNEYIGAIVGKTYAASSRILPNPTPTFLTFTFPEVNPSSALEWATAAGRLHTLLRFDYTRILSEQKNITITLGETIQKVHECYQNGGLESIFYGLLSDPAEKFDAHIMETLTEDLFSFVDAKGVKRAFDLMSLNIERGRESGIPTYNQIRQLCNYTKANSFKDLTDLMSEKSANILSLLYADVNDIDFYIGGLFEYLIDGGAVGSTFACIIGNQFWDWKFGDRFYYENNRTASTQTAFTLPQLTEIKKNTISGLICNNYALTKIQPNGFYLPTDKFPLVYGAGNYIHLVAWSRFLHKFLNLPKNSPVDCSTFPQMDFSAWLDTSKPAYTNKYCGKSSYYGGSYNF